jgi:hypothetical protein
MSGMLYPQVTQYDAATKVNQMLTVPMYFNQAGGITSGDIIAKNVKPGLRCRVAGFWGVRRTAGDTSGTTTIQIQDNASNVISSLAFAQAGGNDLEVVGQIVAAYEVLEATESFKIVATSAETTEGADLDLMVMLQWL